VIDCVSISNSSCFDKNLVVEQHKLRFKEVIQKERWDNVYVLDDMEFDRYDNLATEYLIARDDLGNVVGVTRTYPTTLPYMISEAFTYLSNKDLPSSPLILEASRLVLDRSLLSKEQRKPVIDQLMVAYMERGLQRGIHAYVGFMLPKIWESTFLRSGWDVTWVGPERPLPQTGEMVRAGLMFVTEEMNAKVRETTGIYDNIVNLGENGDAYNPGVATLSNEQNDRAKRLAA
jgi:acyl-homoserine lactone synthase